jgi:hypothetical protein
VHSQVAESLPFEGSHSAHPTGRERPKGPWSVLFSVAVYLLLAILANWKVWAHGFAHTLQVAGSDPVEEIWFVAQTPWSVLHGISPFANNWLNAPTGVDLMDNGTMPLLGLLGAPMTLTLGPIATFNALIVTALALSATTFFLMARRFVAWWPAAFFGGLLYGFSPFAVAVGSSAHLFLLFQAIPPLLILVLDRFQDGSYRSPLWYGLAFGGCFVAQFYISTEATASLAVMTVIGLAFAWLLLVRRRSTVNWPALTKMGVTAGFVMVLGIGYGAWVALEGPQHITGPAQNPTTIAGLSSDPVGVVVPTTNQHFTFGQAGLGDSLVAERDADWRIGVESPGENGTYVGLPLLFVLVVGTIMLRRNRLALFSAVMAVVAMVLSMGKYLHVDGHLTGIPLPFIVLAHLPLLQSGIASRYTGPFWLFAALLFALIVDRVHSVVDAGVGGRSAVVSSALVALALLPLLPSWPNPATAATVPAWFTGAARSVPVGTTVLVYPYPSAQDPSAMLWQSMADMTFRLPGGYAVFATPSGVASFYGTPSALQGALAQCQAGQEPALPTQVIRSDLRSLKAEKVVVAETSIGAACATRLFDQALGTPRSQDGVRVWDAPSHTSASSALMRVTTAAASP